jgi:predicted RNase H-like HicB family nuclease
MYCPLPANNSFALTDGNRNDASGAPQLSRRSGYTYSNRRCLKGRHVEVETLAVSAQAGKKGLAFQERSKRLTFKVMKFVITSERDEDGVWIVECPSIPGCVGQGKSREEALENIHEAVAGCLEVRTERGMPLTVETQQVEVTL